MGDNRLRRAFLIAAPQRPADEVLALARGKVAQPEEAVVNLEPVAARDVEMLLALGVSGLSGLGRREIAALGGCDLVELACILLWVPLHQQKPYI